MENEEKERFSKLSDVHIAGPNSGVANLALELELIRSASTFTTMSRAVSATLTQYPYYTRIYMEM